MKRAGAPEPKRERVVPRIPLKDSDKALPYAERFVRSIKEECLDRIIPIGERHFRQVITAFVEHYHRERNHQGLDNRLIVGTPVTARTGCVRCRRRLGGLLHVYERAA